MMYDWIGYGMELPDMPGYPPMGQNQVVEMPRAGRRLRTFVRAASRQMPRGFDLEDIHGFVERTRGWTGWFSQIQMMPGFTRVYEAIPEGRRQEPSDASLHPALQDLAYEINEDIHEACFAFDDPDIWYPGVDEGIEPVPDEHVELVMWAMQRELNREPRPSTTTMKALPAPPLSELPWRVQRALAERRRLRFQQWGIGRKQWEARTWSLWDVPLDPEYTSRREDRGLSEANNAFPRVAE
jgi:hypothetical protein